MAVPTAMRCKTDTNQNQPLKFPKNRLSCNLSFSPHCRTRTRARARARARPRPRARPRTQIPEPVLLHSKSGLVLTEWNTRTGCFRLRARAPFH